MLFLVPVALNNGRYGVKLWLVVGGVNKYDIWGDGGNRDKSFVCKIILKIIIK